LRAAVEAAKKGSVTKDTIERSIKKGAGIGDEAVQYETAVYEGFTPNKVPVIVECLTDNKTRAAAEIKMRFKKGAMGAPGSVAWMFNHLGVIEATHKDKSLDIESVAIEAGAQNVEPLDAEDVPEGQIGACFYTEISDLDSTNKFLEKAGWVISKSEMSYVPKNYPELTEAQRKEDAEFLQDLNDYDDVYRIYVALK
jgi:YebC/PmpR family DNA-binding regulatory protein